MAVVMCNVVGCMMVVPIRRHGRGCLSWCVDTFAIDGRKIIIPVSFVGMIMMTAAT